MKVHQGWLGVKVLGCPFTVLSRKLTVTHQLWALHTAFNRVTNNGIPKCFLLLGPYLRVCVMAVGSATFVLAPRKGRNSQVATTESSACGGGSSGSGSGGSGGGSSGSGSGGSGGGSSGSGGSIHVRHVYFRALLRRLHLLV
jgi:uncharacterized membrane protein YgcG